MKISESVKLLKALADSSRIQIIHSLFENAQYVEEIAERHDLAISTVSFHLKKLEEADLVYKVKEQYYLMYHVKKQLFDLTLKDIISIKDNQKSVQEKRMMKYKEKVINSFFKQGKLIKIPSQHKKRWVVYEKIVEKFVVDKKYQESEVNEIISEVYEDYCTIRRELIGENIMQRDKGVYWIVKNKFNESIMESQNERGLKNSFIESARTSSNKKTSEKEKRKQLKKIASEKEKQAGVFRILNKSNQKMLIDFSTNVDATLQRHKAELQFGSHRNQPLQTDWNSQGPDDFSFEAIEIIKPEESMGLGFRATLKERTDLFRKKFYSDLYQ